MSIDHEIWIFNGDQGRFPSGVFSEFQNALDFIKKYSLSGTLTEYPVDVGCYEWEVDLGYFVPKKPEHHSPDFIGKYSPGYSKHYHFIGGRCSELENQ